MADQGASGVGKGVWLSLAVVAVAAVVWFGSQADHASVEDEGTVMAANRAIAEPSQEGESGAPEEVEIDDSAGIDPDKTDEERSEAEEAAEGKNTGNLQLG
ncbi:MAG: hypothetical protein ACO3LH_12400 [Steroidobacteraceae bacterium]